MRKNVHDLTAEEHKALSVGSDPDGGYLVPAELETQIDRVVGQMSAMRGLARVRPIGAASYKKPVVISGATSGWAGETNAPLQTGPPQLSERAFVPGKAFAEPQNDRA